MSSTFVTYAKCFWKHDAVYWNASLFWLVHRDSSPLHVLSPVSSLFLMIHNIVYYELRFNLLRLFASTGCCSLVPFSFISPTSNFIPVSSLIRVFGFSIWSSVTGDISSFFTCSYAPIIDRTTSWVARARTYLRDAYHRRIPTLRCRKMVLLFFCIVLHTLSLICVCDCR